MRRGVALTMIVIFSTRENVQASSIMSLDRHYRKVYHDVGIVSFCLTVPGSGSVDP